MGCGGCELFPSPKTVTRAVDTAVKEVGEEIDSHRIFMDLVEEHYARLKNPGPEFKKLVTTTHIGHLRELFVAKLRREYGKTVANAADEAVRMAITCYAAKQHMNKGLSILGVTNKDGQIKTPNKGYAPTFEQLKQFKGRAAETADWPDLLGQSNPHTPWQNGLPRMIFVSDMGDAFSAKGDFPFLKADLMPAIQSASGTRHLWLWLTKRPERMAEFAREIGGFPSNVCAMTTLTGPDADSLKRLKDLKTVKASIRGLSIEPLWERIPPELLDLKGIDWVIVGGESGSGRFTRPFALEWAEEILKHCRKNKVACFVKQIGRKPTLQGMQFRLPVKRTVMPSGRFTDLVTDPHGGDWNEWPDSLRIREFPKQFHEYRNTERKKSNTPRPEIVPKKTKSTEGEAIGAGDHSDFKRLDAIVRRGVAAYMECGAALKQIHDRKLWRIAGHKTWEEYCRMVAGISKPYAHRIVKATEITLELKKSLPNGNDSDAILPIMEAQVRPLQQLEDPEQRAEAWRMAIHKAGGQPTQVEVAEAVFEIIEPQSPKPKTESLAARRSAVIAELLRVVRERKASSWKNVERLVHELNTLDGA
jgi:protein gp37